MKVSGRN